LNSTDALQKIISLQYGFEYRKFKNSLGHIENTQRTRLHSILNYLKPYFGDLPVVDSYESFVLKIKPSHYSNWKPSIDNMRENSEHPFRQECARFEPTSGSTNSIKWIPYSKGFLSEMNRAASAWLYDTALSCPQILRGRHYWSLSWVPPHLRDTHNSNDVDLFPFWQRIFLSKVMAVPHEVKMTETQESSWFASLVYLVACDDLSLVSVWSPTFLLQMLNDILIYKTEIIASLKKGSWAKCGRELAHVSCPKSPNQAAKLQNWGNSLDSYLLKDLWPHLALISAWDSSTAASWANELRRLFPNVRLQGKGLWATEGVVTIPFQDTRTLAIRSHFYEFKCLESGKIFAPWQIENGMFVQPLITASSGLLRYELPDKMEVVDFINGTPCLNFINRINSIDLVGEKIDFDTAQILIKEINLKFGIHGVCFIAERNERTKPKYALMVEGEVAQVTQIEEFLEERLSSNYHYKLSRSLGQLGPCEVLSVNNALDALQRVYKSAIGGNNKVEPIILFEGN
jgi:hypothetical protein